MHHLLLLILLGTLYFTGISQDAAHILPAPETLQQQPVKHLYSAYALIAEITNDINEGKPSSAAGPAMRTALNFLGFSQPHFSLHARKHLLNSGFAVRCFLALRNLRL
jgi:hypothetical protein